MIERLKRKLRHTDDHGSSFVLVIVATTFMCILASAILMGAMMTYKLKYYKLNSLNNFYEVETALDEMYAGVGAATNEHLYSAYTTTAELVVVYDTKNQALNPAIRTERPYPIVTVQAYVEQAAKDGIINIRESIDEFTTDIRMIVIGNVFEWCLREGNADFEGNMSRSLRRYLDSTLEEG